MLIRSSGRRPLTSAYLILLIALSDAQTPEADSSSGKLLYDTESGEELVDSSGAQSGDGISSKSSGLTRALLAFAGLKSPAALQFITVASTTTADPTGGGVRCGEPPFVQNAHVIYNSGEVSLYSCNNGFTLIGQGVCFCVSVLRGWRFPPMTGSTTGRPHCTSRGMSVAERGGWGKPRRIGGPPDKTNNRILHDFNLPFNTSRFANGACRPLETSGRKFWLMFIENKADRPQNLPLEIFVSPKRDEVATVTVTQPLYNPNYRKVYTIYPRDVQTIMIDRSFQHTGIGQNNKSVSIEADRDIVVHGVNREVFTNEAFLSLPLQSLHTLYFVTCWFPATLYCEFGIVATAPNTVVTIEFPPRKVGAGEINEWGMTWGSVYTLELKRAGETFQFQDQADLTGTRISANERIAVFSGNMRTSVIEKGDDESRDHLVEQLPPVSAWRKDYNIMRTPNRTVGFHDWFIIVASEPDTLVTLHGIGIRGGDDHYRLHYAGDYERFNCSQCISDCSFVSATKPIQVVQFVASQRNKDQPDEMTDPSMLVVPAKEHYDYQYTFMTAQYAGNTNMDYNNFLMIIVDSQLKDNLRLDDKPLPTVRWQAIHNPNPAEHYVCGYIKLPSKGGQDSKQHYHINLWGGRRESSPPSRFMAVVYGAGDRESYMYSAGMLLDPQCMPCEQQGDPVWDWATICDAVDNDCDDKIDEEYCDGIDNDGDGRIDEDCLCGKVTTTTSTTTTTTTTTTTPKPTTTTATTTTTTTTPTTTTSEPTTTERTTKKPSINPTPNPVEILDPLCPTPVKRIIGCYNDELHLECSEKNSELVILQSLYGRNGERDNNECGGAHGDCGGIKADCTLEDTLDRVKELCEGEQMCNVSVTKYKLGLGPATWCPVCSQYLTIQYKCVSRIERGLCEETFASRRPEAQFLASDEGGCGSHKKMYSSQPRTDARGRPLGFCEECEVERDQGPVPYTLGSTIPWCANHCSGRSSALTIDLGGYYSLYSLLIQGHRAEHHWITSLSVDYSTDGSNWRHMSSRNRVTIFNGTRNELDLRQLDSRCDSFKTQTDETARYLRLHPRTWSGLACAYVDVVTCGKSAGCKALVAPNTRERYLVARAGEVVTAHCNTGYSSDYKGETDKYSVRCTGSGWNNMEFSGCKYFRRCGDIPPVDNSLWDGSSTVVGSVVQYFCNEGYRLEGDLEGVCQANGQWTESPRCVFA